MALNHYNSKFLKEQTSTISISYLLIPTTLTPMTCKSTRHENEYP